MTARGTGWIPEQGLYISAPHASSLPLVLPPKECYALVDRCLGWPIYDQGMTSSCVAQAVAAAMRTLSGVEPSRRWLYYLAREYDRDLADDGTRISSVCRIMRDVGWCAEPYMRWSETAISEPPTLLARRNAADQTRAVREYAIRSMGESKLELTRAAIASGYPIVFGAVVDEPYLDLSTWEPVAFDGPPVGGHAQLAVGYDEDGIVVLNSWGGNWGVGGLAHLSWRCWTDQCLDLRVIAECDRPTTQ
jgi:C1A family cysteine protease